MASNNNESSSEMSNENERLPAAVENGSASSVPNNTSVHTNGRFDAFLYFSNQRRRMAFLKYEEVISTDDAPAPQDVTEERTTRISFELHPSLILDDLLMETGATEVEVEEMSP